MFFILFSIFCTIIVFPVTLTCKVFCNFNDKKVFFSCKVINCFNLTSGFLNVSNTRLNLTLKNNKLKSLKFKDVLPNKKKTDLILHFDIIKFQSAILLGSEFFITLFFGKDNSQ